MTGPGTFTGFTHACHGCDMPRHDEQAFCASCDEVTVGYAWSDQDEQDFHRNRAAKLVRDAGNTLVPLVDDRAECGVKGGVR